MNRAIDVYFYRILHSECIGCVFFFFFFFFVQCCGTELYHPAKRETRCCNGMLQLNVPEGSKCAGQSIYNPNIETVCEKNLYPVPHGQCCGKDLLKPSEELCCNGYRYPKSPGIVCCGNEAYNSSDSRQKCCSGHLHKLSSVTGMAECCGTQVVEDFTKQQCCRSSQLELIYISQPGFSCCGSQYYNSSEFSCCEEVVYSTMRFGHNFAGHVGQCSHLNLKNLSAQCCNTSGTGKHSPPIVKHNNSPLLNPTLLL
ncbi:galaxin-like [Arapaima gigas]